MKHYSINLEKGNIFCWKLERIRLRIYNFTVTSPMFIFVLASCVNIPIEQTIQKDIASPHTISTSLVQSFSGRFILKYKDRYEKQHNVYGRFKLQKDNVNVSLELRGPLGQTIAIIHESPNNVTLELPNYKQENGHDVDKLIQSIFGFSLPFSKLYCLFLHKEASVFLRKIIKNQNDIACIHQIRQGDWKIDIEYKVRLSISSIKRLNIVHLIPYFDIKVIIDP